MISKKEFIRRFEIAKNYFIKEEQFFALLDNAVVENHLLSDYVKLMMEEIGGEESLFWDLMFDGFIEYWENGVEHTDENLSVMRTGEDLYDFCCF